MSRERPRNLAASVAARLRQRSLRTGEDHQVLLTRYGLERLMYRLSRSTSADRFVVKGALAFLVWADEPFRVTRDLDLLATPEPSSDEMMELFRSLCRMAVDDDGIVFDEATTTVTEIREDQQYGGLRVTMKARLGQILIPIQVDVGFGDAVTPEPMAEQFPVLLDFPPPVLRLYQTLLPGHTGTISLKQFEQLDNVLTALLPDAPRGDGWKVDYGAQKTRLMPLFTEAIQQSDLNTFDLMDRMKELIDFIGAANSGSGSGKTGQKTGPHLKELGPDQVSSPTRSS